MLILLYITYFYNNYYVNVTFTFYRIGNINKPFNIETIGNVPKITSKFVAVFFIFYGNDSRSRCFQPRCAIVKKTLRYLPTVVM